MGMYALAWTYSLQTLCLYVILQIQVLRMMITILHGDCWTKLQGGRSNTAGIRTNDEDGM